MPIKVVTETQVFCLIGNTPLQVEVVLPHPKSHISQNTPEKNLTA
jgi:homoserine O-succinyltransferase